MDGNNVLDAAPIAAAQAVEHYEMTRCGTLIACAKELGADDCIDLLDQNLEEEKAADEKLTKALRPGAPRWVVGLLARRGGFIGRQHSG